MKKIYEQHKNTLTKKIDRDKMTGKRERKGDFYGFHRKPHGRN
jgi:hypothetical protein